MSWRLLLCLTLILPGCAGGDSPPPGAPEESVEEPRPAPAQAESPETMTSRAEADRPLAVGNPVTLRLKLSQELIESLDSTETEDAPERFLRLSVLGLENPGVHTNVRIFLNLPEADLETPLDSPHYVGQSAFHPLGEDARGQPQTFLFDAGSTLRRLDPELRLIEEGTLLVTLVLAPPPGPAPEGAGVPEVPFDGVKLEAVP